MTSDFGAGDGMTTTAELTVSGIGYLLTAALAGQRYDEAAGLWRELDDSAQAEVITALGVQARAPRPPFGRRASRSPRTSPSSATRPARKR